jgi:hypothetical protein
VEVFRGGRFRGGGGFFGGPPTPARGRAALATGLGSITRLLGDRADDADTPAIVRLLREPTGHPDT